MPKILLYEDHTDEQTGIVTPAGSTLSLHPNSPVYKRLISNQSAEDIIPLPKDAPAYKQLMKAGITSLQLLFGAVDELESIKGIGEKTADEVRTYINQLKNKGE